MGKLGKRRKPNDEVTVHVSFYGGSMWTPGELLCSQAAQDNIKKMCEVFGTRSLDASAAGSRPEAPPAAVDFKGHQLVEVSTEGSKSRIGFALESGVAADGEPDIAIAIAPLVSGYRHGKTRGLKITTHYGPVLLSTEGRQPAGNLLEHFRVVVPLGEVASARCFDPDVYELFHQDADRPTQPESAAQSAESAR